MNNNNKINFTTSQVEDLWSELLQAWPAVKNNPEIAEKIEKLWDILKNSGNDNFTINREIQNLLDNDISSANSTTNSLATTTQPDQDIDSLIAEILGENYQNEISNSPIETNTDAENITSTLTGTEELDKLVADILGDDWLNEDSSNSTTSRSLTDESQTIKADSNIDSLVYSIIGNDLNNEINKPDTSNFNSESQKLIDDKQDIDQLLNEILNEDTINESSTNDINNSEENIDELIKGILTEETDVIETTSNLNSLSNDEQTQITGSVAKEENIDDLINEIMNKESDNDELDTPAAANEENIDDLINDILENKTDKNVNDDTDADIERIEIQRNKDKSSYQPDSGRVFINKTKIQASKKTEKSHYIQDEKQGSNILILLLLLLLILLFIGAWQFFIDEETIQDNEITTEQYIDNTYSLEEDIFVNEAPEVETKPEYTPPKYTPPVVEYNPAVPDYSENVEHKEDITLTLNSPETAIDNGTDSTIFNESGTASIIEQEPLQDKNNSTESIPEQSPLTDADREKELALKNKAPIKALAKRKVIIHKIVKGDTLWAIAKRYVNNPYRYPELAKLSKIKNPNRIYPGKKVRIIIYIQ